MHDEQEQELTYLSEHRHSQRYPTRDDLKNRLLPARPARVAPSSNPEFRSGKRRPSTSQHSPRRLANPVRKATKLAVSAPPLPSSSHKQSRHLDWRHNNFAPPHPFLSIPRPQHIPERCSSIILRPTSPLPAEHPPTLPYLDFPDLWSRFALPRISDPTTHHTRTQARGYCGCCV